MSAPAALSIQRLTYQYPTNWFGKRVVALDGISLDVGQGECFGFLGHNGAGKTTTIKCVLSLATPTAGTVAIFGDLSRSSSIRKQIGYLPEHPYFYDHLSVRETLEMYGALAGLNRSELPSRLEETIARLDLQKLRDRKLRGLSKGQTQRVGLAQAILHKPRLIILDEPFSGLDPLGRRKFREIILAEKRAGATIFMSTHVLSDVEQMCDRASILVNGTLRGVFDIRELQRNATSSFELLAPLSQLLQCGGIEPQSVIRETDTIGKCIFSSRETAERALRISLDSGIEILEFHQVSESLEDLFVRLVSKGNAP